MTVAAALIRNELGQVLLGQKKAEDPLGNLWEFPGGKQEPGEIIEHTLMRELDEEFGLSIHRIHPLAVFHQNTHLGSIEFHAFMAEANSEITRMTAHQDYAWVAITQVHKYSLAPADQELFTKFLEASQT